MKKEYTTPKITVVLLESAGSLAVNSFPDQMDMSFSARQQLLNLDEDMLESR